MVVTSGVGASTIHRTEPADHDRIVLRSSASPHLTDKPIAIGSATNFTAPCFQSRLLTTAHRLTIKNNIPLESRGRVFIPILSYIQQ